MADVGRLYAEGRERITDLVHTADPEGVTPLPPCPGWTVKDVVAHLTGVCADILAGRIEGVATEPWTARQVDERRDAPMEAVLEEWGDVGPRCEEIAEAFGEAGVQWLTDLTTHEHDIRCAVGRPGERDSEAIAVGFPWLTKVAGDVDLTGLVSDVREGERDGVTPSFRVLTPESDDITLGPGEPQATVKADRFDFYRALTGRRSEEQVAAFDWDDDHRKYLWVFSRGPFTMATSPINE